MRYTKVEKSQLITEFKNRGLSIKKFSEAKGIKAATLTYWLRSEDKSLKGGFQEIEIGPLNGMVIEYPNGIKIHFDGYADVDMLKQLVQ